MAVLVASETITANSNGSVITPAAGMFMLSVSAGEVVLYGRRASTGTWLPVFQESAGPSGRESPALRTGMWAIYTCAGMEYRCTAGPNGATVEANQ